MCAIDWCSFTWQAFATLLTGFAAVGGAVFIGLRQHDLVREQADISRQQAATAASASHVARLKLRADLFEQRLEVYQAIHNYLRAALSVNMKKIWDVTPELEKQLIRAKFLFSNAITAELELAIADSDALYDAKYERDEAREAGNDVTALNAALRPLRKNLRERLRRLADTLGDEMKLYESP